MAIAVPTCAFLASIFTKIEYFYILSQEHISILLIPQTWEICWSGKNLISCPHLCCGCATLRQAVCSKGVHFHLPSSSRWLSLLQLPILEHMVTSARVNFCSILNYLMPGIAREEAEGWIVRAGEMWGSSGVRLEPVSGVETHQLHSLSCQQEPAHSWVNHMYFFSWETSPLALSSWGILSIWLWIWKKCGCGS